MRRQPRYRVFGDLIVLKSKCLYRLLILLSSRACGESARSTQNTARTSKESDSLENARRPGLRPKSKQFGGDLLRAQLLLFLSMKLKLP
mmetsp:Transcript_3929/g.8768  ORF Transcript_3929/g.8768 Transcript_3929/m.8768 type:complete len:89 (-) Transcript_3929:230-496(-)